MGFEFKDVLLKYFNVLDSLDYKLKKQYKTKEEIQSLRYQNLDWLHYLKHYMFNFKDLVEEITDKRILNKKEYLLPEDKRCVGCEDGKPYKIIKYRGFKIPVYNDDYGQQDFAIILGKTISGGTYNMFSTELFIDELDYILEDKFIEGTYDMREEMLHLPLEKENKDGE